MLWKRDLAHATEKKLLHNETLDDNHKHSSDKESMPKYLSYS